MLSENTKQSGVGLPVGAKIGKYEIREKIGTGGQAIVYKCHDPILDRFVAIKQISPHLAEDPKFLERFRREAQILAKLGAEQPEIITLHDVIEDERGLFIVMEHFAGHSLEVILNDTNGPVETKAALQVFWRLAAGLYAVHAAGIIHRDLKPANILVGDGLRVKITDFGVAASVTGQTSMVLGTTKYMAPEIFEGGAIDGRADMYSLGFMVYEMLVGRPKFNEIFAEVVRDKHSEALRWMKWHGNESVTAPAVNEVNPAVPQSLSDIVMKMIAKRPENRFASMEELGRAIKQTFSTRGKGGAAGSARKAASAPAAQPVAALAQKTPATPADEADELVIPEPLPTAPLPRKKLSPRAKLVLGITAFVLAIAAGVVVAVMFQQEKWQSARQADRLYAQSVQRYSEGIAKADPDALQKAVTGFEGVLSAYPQTLQGAKASVLLPLSKAQLNLLENNWSEAVKQQELAEAQLKTFERGNSDKESPWASKVALEIDGFRQHRINTQIFVETMAAARSALATDNFAEATRIVAEKFGGGFSPTPDQDKQIASFKTEVEVKQVRAQVATGFREAKELRDQNQIASAQVRYDQLSKLLDEQGAKTLEAAELAQLRGKLSQAKTEIAGLQKYEDHIKAAEGARRKGDKKAELSALENANRLRPEPAHATRIKDLHAQIEVEEGRMLVSQNKLPAARAAFERALRHDPNNREAKAELASMDQTQRWSNMVSSGDSEASMGRHQEAIAAYAEAEKLRPDETVRAKIVESRFRLKMAQADGLRDARKYAEATTAYEQARAMKAEAAAEIDAKLAAMSSREQYEKLLERGDAAVRQRRWTDAVELYRQAKALGLGPEADQKIADARYAENMSKGQAAFDQGDANGALGYYKIAQRHKDTAEIRTLIAEAEKKLKEGK